MSPIVKPVHLHLDGIPAKIEKDLHSPLPSSEDSITVSTSSSLTASFGENADSVEARRCQLVPVKMQCLIHFVYSPIPK